MKDPFANLQSREAIKKAYRKLCMTCHPDKRSDKEAATIEFRELTQIYQQAMLMVGTVKPKPPPPPPPGPKPAHTIIEGATIWVDGFEIDFFGEVIRDIRVSREILKYGGICVITLKTRREKEQSFEFDVPPNTKNGQKFRFSHHIGILEIQLVSEKK